MLREKAYVSNIFNQSFTGWIPRFQDVYVEDLQPGEVREVGFPTQNAPLTGGLPPFTKPRFRGIVMEPFGDLVRVNRHFVATFRCRVNRMVQVFLFVELFPGQPWAPAEAGFLASNPEVPDMIGHLGPSTGADFEIDGAFAAFTGLRPGDRLLPQGLTIGDGQMRAFPLVIVWPGRMTPADYASADAFRQMAIGCTVRSSVSPEEKSPWVPRVWRPEDFVRQHLPGCIARLHSWDNGPLSWAKNSGDTGAQADQGVIANHHSTLPDGVGAENVTYLEALTWGRRPCHHTEENGSLLQRNPQRLRMWSGRAHWHRGVSPDQLGKPREITPEDTHGWYGPDRQHWFLNTVRSAYLERRSPLLQWYIKQQAQLFKYQQTTEPNVSTTTENEERSAGWEALVALLLFDCLEDRQEALHIRALWEDRIDVYVQQWSRPNWEVKVWRPNPDARILWDIRGGFEKGWLVYQQAAGALFMWLAGARFNYAPAKHLAFEGALAVVEHGYSRDPVTGEWIGWDFLGCNPDGSKLRPDQYVEGNGAHRTDFFNTAWLPGAAWVVLQSRPEHTKAREIWELHCTLRHVAGGRGDLGNWFPVGPTL